MGAVKKIRDSWGTNYFKNGYDTHSDDVKDLDIYSSDNIELGEVATTPLGLTHNQSFSLKIELPCFLRFDVDG
ncbi:hypothetical protein Q1G98_004104 [Vibrio alginolyticus]|nr:hypothetical protein [Vibrio alginolyticus]